MSANGDQNRKGSHSRIANYQNILDNNPRSYIFAQLAEEYVKLGEADKAIEICRRGLAHNPNFSDGLYVLGVAYFKKGEKDAALDILAKILHRQPDHYLAREALHRMGYNDEAIVDLAAERDTVPDMALENITGETLQIVAEIPVDVEMSPSPRPLVAEDDDAVLVQQKAKALSARRVIPMAAGDVRSALKDDIVSGDNLPDDPVGFPPWVRYVFISAIVVLIGLGYLGANAYFKYQAKKEINKLLEAADATMLRDTYTAYTDTVQRLSDGLNRHPDSMRLRALLVETYAKLLVDFSPDSHDWQAAMETLNAGFPASSFDDSDLLSAQAYRSFYLKKLGDLRFLIDSAHEKGLITPSMICLDGELHAYDRDFLAAIKLYDESLKDEPGQLRTMYKKAVAFAELKDYAAAKIALKLLLEKEADHQRGRMLLWEVQLASGTGAIEMEKLLKPYMEKHLDTLPIVSRAHLLHLYASVDFLLGRNKEALDRATHSVGLNPSANSLFLLGKIQFKLGRYGEAKTNAENAIKQNPDEKAHHAFLGRIYFLEDNKTKALEEMELAIDDSTEELDLLVMAGDAASKLHMYEKAVKYYERASFVNFQNLDLKKKLVLIYIEKQDLKDARRRIEKMLLEHPNDPTTYFLSGQLSLAEGNANKAEKDFAKGFKLDPTDRDILLEFVKMHFEKDEIKSGLKILRRLEQHDPSDIEVLEKLAGIAYAIGDLRESHRLYTKLSELRPQIPPYRLYLAALDSLDGKEGRAKQAVEEELAKDPKLGLAHILRGVFLFREGDAKKAEAQIVRGIKLDSKNAEGHYWLGKLKQYGNDTTWAKNEFEIALECEPIYPKALYEIGMIHFVKGQFDQARGLFVKAMKIFALYPEEKRYQVKIYIRLGEIEIFLNRRSQGLKLVKRARKLDPEAAEPYYIMARELPDKFRNPQKATRLLNKALELDPDLADVHYEFGLINMARGNKREAVKAFRTYLKRAPKGRYAEDAQKQVNKLTGR